MQRLMSWVDEAVARLISDHRHRLVIRRSHELDERVEKVAQKLKRRKRQRGAE